MGSESSWLRVSLSVDGEMAEAVAEVLSRFAPGGIVIESTAIAPDPDSEGHPTGPLQVSAYIPVGASSGDVRQRLEEALWHLGRIRPLPPAEFELIQESNWAEIWQQNYRPVPIGDHLIVVPAWMEPPQGERIPIRIDPGMAFGTGTHPTTQLCLQMLEDILMKRTEHISPSMGNSDINPCENRKGITVDPKTEMDVIDVGCGSGILSIAALKMGVKRVLGVDTDPRAIEAARRNAVINGVADNVEYHHGSLAEILGGSFSFQRAHLVLANILAPVLLRLLDEGLGELVDPAGMLVLSGMLAEQAPDIQAALSAHNFELYGRRQMEDWVVLMARPCQIKS